MEICLKCMRVLFFGGLFADVHLLSQSFPMLTAGVTDIVHY